MCVCLSPCLSFCLPVYLFICFYFLHLSLSVSFHLLSLPNWVNSISLQQLGDSRLSCLIPWDHPQALSPFSPLHFSTSVPHLECLKLPPMFMMQFSALATSSVFHHSNTTISSSLWNPLVKLSNKMDSDPVWFHITANGRVSRFFRIILNGGGRSNHSEQRVLFYREAVGWTDTCLRIGPDWNHGRGKKQTGVLNTQLHYMFIQPNKSQSPCKIAAANVPWRITFGSEVDPGFWSGAPQVLLLKCLLARKKTTSKVTLAYSLMCHYISSWVGPSNFPYPCSWPWRVCGHAEDQKLAQTSKLNITENCDH